MGYFILVDEISKVFGEDLMDFFNVSYNQALQRLIVFQIFGSINMDTTPSHTF
jgi:hypothetical protein